MKTITQHEIDKTYYELVAGRYIDQACAEITIEIEKYFNCTGNFATQYLYTYENSGGRTLVKFVVSWGLGREENVQEFVHDAEVLITKLTEHHGSKSKLNSPRRQILKLASEIIGHIEHRAIRRYIFGQ